MKHLGVRVKEPRNLESKRVRINFLPKIKVHTSNNCSSSFPSWLVHVTVFSFTSLQKSIKTEKEGEEKKKPRFPSILGPQRWPSRIEAAAGDGWLLKIPESFESESFPSRGDFDGAVVSVVSEQSFGRPSPASETTVSAHARRQRAHGGRSSQRQPVERGSRADSLGAWQHFVPQQRVRELGQQPRR